MRYWSFSADHTIPKQVNMYNNHSKRARKPVLDWDDVDEPPVAAKSAKDVISGMGFYSEEDGDMIDDPFNNPEFLQWTKNDKKKNGKIYGKTVMAKKNEPELSPESDSDDSGSIHTASEDSIDETDLSEDSDDSDEDDSSDIDMDGSEEEDSDDTGEEDDDDSDEDDDNSDSDDDSDDDSNDSDGDSDDDPDTDDDDDDEDDDDDDDDSEDDDSDDDDDEDDEEDDDSDEIDDDEDSDDDDTDDTDYDDSDEEDDDEEDDNDEDSIDDADEEEDEPVKVPYGAPRKGGNNVKNSTNFSTRGYKNGFDEAKYAEEIAVPQVATMASEHWRLPFMSTKLFGETTINQSKSSLEHRLSSITLRDLLNPNLILPFGPSGVVDFETQTSKSLFSWETPPQNVRRVEKNEEMRLFK